MRFKRNSISQIRNEREVQSFEQIYETYFHRIYAFVSSRLESQKDAEDVVADIFLKAMQRFTQFRGENLSSWIFTIAHNTVQDIYRKRKPLLLELEGDVIVDTETPEEILLTNERRTEILEHIQALSSRRQEVITLKFYAELRNQEIAEVLGINEQSVASHLHRALTDLRVRLTPTISDQVEQE